MELIPLLTQINRFWSLGGGINLGGGDGSEVSQEDHFDR